MVGGACRIHGVAVGSDSEAVYSCLCPAKGSYRGQQ